jgi:DNA-directed RNA polymerase subunit RPC12/RpoP
MLKYECDRCGFQSTDQLIEIMVTKERRTAHGIDYRLYTCTKCYKELRKWFNLKHDNHKNVIEYNNGKRVT